MTENKFYPELLLDYLEVSSDCTTSDIADRIEAAAQIWKQKSLRKESGRGRGAKYSWGGKVKGIVGDAGKSKLLARRAETLLKNLRLRFPGLPQTALDMSKIQYNKVFASKYLLTPDFASCYVLQTWYAYSNSKHYQLSEVYSLHFPMMEVLDLRQYTWAIDE